MTTRAPKAPLRYVSGWIVAGGLALVIAVLQAPRVAASTGLLLLLAMIAGELAEVEFRVARTTTSFTLLEAAVSASLFLVEPAAAVVVTVAGLTIGQLIRGREPLKIAFNAAQMAVATGLAAVLVHAWGAPVVADDPRAMGLAAVAMLGYALVTLAATSGLLARVTGRSIRALVVEHGPHLVMTILGNSALGLLGAVIALRHPHLLVLVVAPATAMYLSSRGAIRTRALLGKLRADHARLDQIVSEASDGIVLLDGNGVIEVWSRSMGRIAGVDASVAVGMRAVDLPLADPDDVAALTIPNDGVTEIDGTFHLHDGTATAVVASHSLLRDEQGEVTADVVLVRDVTRQREVDALKGNFVARVSHELRTPLTPIKGLAEVLLRRRDRLAPEQQDVALRQIVERAEHLSRIVEDLLLVSQTSRTSDDPAAEMDLRPLATAPIVQQAAQWFRTEHPDRELTLSEPSHLPQVLGDPLRLTQILTNLLSNAAKYSSQGAPVDVAVTNPAGAVIIDVLDRGQGIPAAKREEIFEAFQRLEDPMMMRTGGIGVGLYLARRFARAMDGELTALDRPGGGTTFRLVLPALASHVDGEHADPHRA